jgi:hypothetical protein
MTFDWMLRLVLFGLIHWILAGILIQDLASRRKVIGGHKAPWAVIMLIIPAFGSLLYLAFHPQILAPHDGEDHDRDRYD